MTTITAGPSVPSGLMALRHGGDVGTQIAEGAKNLWVRTGHQWNMTLGTYNVRSLKTDDRLMELEHELEHITWDIIGLSEVRRRGIGYMTLKSGHQFFHSGNDSSHAGVGFLINKALAGNVIEVKGISERICKLVLQLNKKCKINVVQVYAPTSSYEDEVVEDFYEKVSLTVESCKGSKTFVIGDFNAKVSQKEQGDHVIGKFGLGMRNSRGEMLLEFAARNRMKVMNTFFQKPQKRKWTWQGPNGTVKMKSMSS